MISKVIENDILKEVFLGNTVAQYIDALLYFFIAFIVLFVVQKIAMSRFAYFAQKTETEIDNIVLEFIQSIRPHLYTVLAIYISLRTLAMSETMQNVFDVIVIVVVIFQITRSLQVVIEFAAKKIGGADTDEHVHSAAHLLGTIATIIVWVFGIMMILSNIGVNITSLVAGVGIGGIAIAFAVKEALSDLLSSFSIYFDKPFKAGDVVKIDDKVGTVKKIGIKTTRIQSSEGEELVVSNQDMTSSRVHNFKKMEHRNVRIHFGVSFETSAEVLRQIPAEVENIINAVKNAECKRVHFKEFGDWGLMFEVMYVINSRDYTVYMDARQSINLGIKEIFDQKDIELAYPAKMEMAGGKK